MLGVIPARKGSERILNKNFREFAGKPLLMHTLGQAREAQSLDFIYVSTDNDEFIARQPSELKNYFIRRPDRLCHKKARGYTYVKHAVEYLKESEGVQATHFVSLPPTSPLKRPVDIDNSIDILLSNNQIDTVTSMVPVNQVYHGLKQKVVGEDGCLQPYYEAENDMSTYMQLPKVYVRNCAIYASHIGVLEEQSMIGQRCIPYFMPSEFFVDINEMLDFELAEYLFKKYLTK